MVLTPSHTAEGQRGEKRVKRHSRPHVPRTSTQSSPLVIVFALAGAVLLVLGAIAGAMYFNRPAPDTGKNQPAVSSQEAPAPPNSATR
jgi:hypothetical protein